MSKAVKERGGLDIVDEILSLTRMMTENLEDTDFLVLSIDKRGQLMEEYDKLKASNPYAVKAIEKDMPEIKAMLNEIIGLDEKVNRALSRLRYEAKRDLEGSNTTNKVLNYTKNAISSSGSYMDYKK